jgi:molybdate transport system substrate-binding protein
MGGLTRAEVLRRGAAGGLTLGLGGSIAALVASGSKIVLGEGDAGFVYRTDVTPVANDIKFIRLPTWSQPPVRYQICLVKSSDNKAAARAFINRVLGPTGRRLLTSALFTIPPR